MKRRKFLASVAALSFAGISLGQARSLPVVLRGGRCFSKNELQHLDVGIDAGGKLVLGEPGTLDGLSIIDATNRIVSPGFIDILSDNTANPQRTYSIVEKYKVGDGVTTALQMHGGSADIAGYYRTFGTKPHFINYGVSTAVMRVRYAVGSIPDRKRRVEKCLEEGALGVSHSIEYQPTPFDEVLTYAKLAKKYDRPFFLHLRYSSEQQELEGVKEAIRLAGESGARVHIDHLHSTGGTFHMSEALTLIRDARSSGAEITCCVYPYSFWATYLHSTRFDAGWQERYHLTYSDLQLVGTGERLTKESFAKYRALKKLVAVPAGTMPMDKTVDFALKEEFCLIGSDGGIEYAANANSHPRGAGCFSTALRHGQELGITIETMLFKMTSGPVKLVGAAMKGRGALETGGIADLTVFDPASVDGTATVANPNQFSKGIDYVFVNGQLTFRQGVAAVHRGQAIKY